MTKIIERFRENYPEGRELYCRYSSYEPSHWQLSVWINLDRWGLGVDTEVDPGGFWQASERHRFFSVYLGPLAVVLMRTSPSPYAP